MQESDSDSFDRLGESSEDNIIKPAPAKRMDVVESEKSEQESNQIQNELERKEPAIRESMSMATLVRAPARQPDIQTMPIARPTTGGKSLLTILSTLKRGPSLVEFRSESRTQTIARMEKCSDRILEFFEANKEIITFDK